MAEQNSAQPNVLVVGSGPVGAAYVRLLTQTRPDLDVLVVEARPTPLGDTSPSTL